MRETTDHLDAYLAHERSRPFEWTSLANGDCQLFVAGWAERIGWPDAGAPWRGLYSSEDSARRLMEERGGAVWAWTNQLGPPRIGSDARRGDVGLLAVDGWHLGMICTGRLWVLRDGKRGIRFCHRSADIAWDMDFS